MWLKVLMPVALIALNFACYYRTMSGFFLADDFVHVAYLFKVFSGHPELLWQNFLTNWMQAEGTQFYRPLISLTLALDYLLFGVNAAGYHLTNLLYQIASTIFLFLTCRLLFPGSDDAKANWLAFFAAAFFAASPLHPEVVSWIIARVDSVATTFYLAAFWLFLRAQKGDRHKRLNLTFALLAFALSLISKEMAVTLPPAFTLWSLLCGKQTGSIKERVRATALSTWPFWLMLACYLGLRTAVLGTFSGGYAGSIGEGLSNSLMKRWFYDNSFVRVLFPFNDEIFSASDRLRKQLKILYQLAGCLFITRLFISVLRRNLGDYIKRLLLALFWFALVMVPTYQVWNLTQSLQGSRFIYMGTAPLCLLLVLLVFPAVSKRSDRADQPKHWSEGTFGAWLDSCSLALLTCFLLIFTTIAYRNNTAWVYASKGVKALKEQIVQSLDHLPYGKHMILLNIPQRYCGAHMLYNAATMGVLLSPPLCDKDYSRRVITFEPMTYGDSELIVASRMRRLLAHPERYVVFDWDEHGNKLVPLHLTNSAQTVGADLKAGLPSQQTDADHLLVSRQLDLPTLAVDFIDVDADIKAGQPSSDQPYLELWWTSQSAPLFSSERRLALKADPQTHNYRFLLSQHKRWLAAQKVKQLAISVTPQPFTLRLKTLTVPAETRIPELKPAAGRNSAGRSMDEDNIGVCRPGKTLGNFSFDVSKVNGAVKAIYEISKPDAWFEHYSGEMHDQQRSTQITESGDLKGLQSDSYAIETSKLKQPGFYELRVLALDKDEKVTGYSSDPINIQISGEDLAKHI